MQVCHERTRNFDCSRGSEKSYTNTWWYKKKPSMVYSACHAGTIVPVHTPTTMSRPADLVLAPCKCPRSAPSLCSTHQIVQVERENMFARHVE